jgi:hypothetical protein
MFRVESVESSEAMIRIFDKTLGCDRIAGPNPVAIPGYVTNVIGSYAYTTTIFGASTWDQTVDMQVERTPLLCGGGEVRGILNVGEMIDSGMGLKVVLEDISRDGEAMLLILDSNGNEFMRFTLAEGGARLLENLGETCVVSINEVSAGVLLIGKWADITVQTCE